VRARGLVVGLALLAAGPPRARAETADGFLARLAAQNRTTRTLSARFVQRKRAALFKSELRTEGRLSFQAPDRLRWESFAPDAVTLLVRGSRAELRLPGESPRALDLRSGGALAALTSQLLVWLGARPASELKKDYTVSLDPRAPCLRLVPRDNALRRHVSALTLTFTRALVLERIEVEQAGGDRTTIELVKPERNGALPADAFR
jgi:outer membrane lipoprotein carrier protein